MGFGSGYLTSCFGRILSSNGNDKDSRTLFGKVWGIEYIDSLVELARENTEKKVRNQYLIC